MASDHSSASESEPDSGASKQPLSDGHLLRSTSVVSSMTFLSRILGLVRDVVFARFFGATIVMDAFLVANRIPNMLRRFFAEGAFSQGFVPVMARYREKHDQAEAKQLVDAVAGTLGLILFLISLAGVIVAPILVAIVAPGFIGEDGRFDLATAMLRFTFPYLLFVSLTAFAGGILNTYGRFAVPAFTPVILNVVLIAGALWLAPNLAEPGMALAYAVFAAGLIRANSCGAATALATRSSGCQTNYKTDASRDIRFVGRADQCSYWWDHCIVARRRKNQFAVFCRSADGVPARIVWHCACHRYIAVPFEAARERITS